MRRFNLLLLCAILGVLTSCTSTEKTNQPSLTVSIEPLRYLTEKITGNSFLINVMVPNGSGPETYEPTAAQMRLVAHSDLYIYIGLIDFEKNLTRSIKENMPQVGLTPLWEGIPLIEGSCGHDHMAHSLEHSSGKSHGVDPHIWSAPSCLKVMAKTLFLALEARYPDSTTFKPNYERLMLELDSLDHALEKRFSQGNRHFLIYHPALTYLARDYGLTQIAIEEEGKEPSAVHIREAIDLAKKFKIKHILFQRQFSENTVRAISAELGIGSVEIDPLGYDIAANLNAISQLIVE